MAECRYQCCHLRDGFAVPAVSYSPFLVVVAIGGNLLEPFKDSGLRPGRRNSGMSETQLHISKEGDRYLRTLLVQGAHNNLGPFGQGSDERSVAIAPAVSWVMRSRVAELAVWGSWAVSWRFSVGSLLTITRLRPPEGVLIP